MPRGRRRPVSVDESLRAVASHDERFDYDAAIKNDPIQFPKAYPDPDDRALVALLSALMAFGRVGIINAKLTDLCARLGPRPATLARARTRAELRGLLDGFTHRTFRGADVADLLFAVGALSLRDGRVLGALERAWERHGDLRAALSEWVGALREAAWPGGPDRTQKHLLPDPDGASASKRLMLFLRWVVRDRGVDLGLTKVIPASALVIPVDVHIGRVAFNLGLTTRTDASWRTAEEITLNLRRLNPADPVRYDFALCHQGIEGPCPDAPKAGDCDGCAFFREPVCRHWR